MNVKQRMRPASMYQFLTIIVASAWLSGCGVYSFQPAKISDDLKSINVRNFSMVTAGGPQNMTLSFNEKLKEYYQRNTNLKLIPTEADLTLDGAIVGYELTPVSATASDKAALNRLTIRVEVSFYNRVDPKADFEKEFSFYQDFSQQQSLTEVEGRLVPIILDQLVLNIFNDTAAQW